MKVLYSGSLVLSLSPRPPCMHVHVYAQTRYIQAWHTHKKPLNVKKTTSFSVAAATKYVQDAKLAKLPCTYFPSKIINTNK